MKCCRTAEVITAEGSAKLSDDRPAFRQMIQESEKKEFSIILVWKLDRFSRDRYELSQSFHYK